MIEVIARKPQITYYIVLHILHQEHNDLFLGHYLIGYISRYIRGRILYALSYMSKMMQQISVIVVATHN